MSIVIKEKENKINFSQVLRSPLISRQESGILMAFLLKISLEVLLTHSETEIRPAVYKRFKLLEAKRLKNWPIAYLTGVKEFYGFDFKVSPAVLTPRPETEYMVEEIVEIIKNRGTGSKEHDKSASLKPIIIDLGTGSGAIIISVAKELKRLAPTIYRRAEFLAVDISVPALKMAKNNAAQHKLARKIKFYQGNLLSPFKLNKRDLSQSELIIAANLPYLTPAQIKKSPSISREPFLALDGGSDGLKYYRELFKQLRELFKQLSELPTVGNLRIICEIDESQAKKIKTLTKKYFPHAASEIICDLSGKKRFLFF
ncbi:MAG: peptide chain release factor N(5)-glutamine methyltransferase [Candidatus Falkowbacteria bacterium]|nr:peptide chain release factor N(5)-glutamine methyltransferase [Candidatus Falkowbacteria bacterium]